LIRAGTLPARTSPQAKEICQISKGAFDMQLNACALRLITIFCTALFLVAPGLAGAQDTATSVSFSNPPKEPIPINVLVGQSKVITFDRPLVRFSMSNPEVAEGILVSPRQVVVNGKGFGQVNFIAWEENSDRFIVFDVFVRTNLSLIDSQVRALFPNEDIRLSQANGSVVISGSVKDPLIATRIDNVVQAAGFKTVNMLELPVKNAVQVQLLVRVAEVSRNRLRDLGTSYAYQSRPGVGGFIGSGGGPYQVGSVEQGQILGTVTGSALNLFVMGGNAFNFIRALQTQGALRSLAEPNLIAIDGQQASFLAGGEFPIPVVQGSSGSGTNGTSVTVVFKEYGVRLNFKPTILDEDHIRLEMEPEVSTIDFANGVKFSGFTIPALKTRRAHTGVELRDGQSFALAGLLDNSETRSLSKVPLIGDVPILGELFKSRSFQKNETELMFIVTAQLVKPLNKDDVPQLRGIDGLKSGSVLGVEPQGEGIKGPSGYSNGGTSINSNIPAMSAAQGAPAVTTPVVQPKTVSPPVKTVTSAAPDNSNQTAPPAVAQSAPGANESH
jgi:pilus assembly protein CpaC